MVVVHMNVCAQVSVPGSSGFLPSITTIIHVFCIFIQ